MANKQPGYKRNKFFSLAAVIMLLAVIFSPIITWFFIPDKKIEVTILDKTVPQDNYREHKGLIWLLNSNKYVKNDGLAYSLLDYYGFFPGINQTYSIRKFPVKLNETDLIYIADTYGVYTQDFYSKSKNAEGERSELIYGGTKPEEVATILTTINNSNKYKTLVVEFNSLATPTAKQVSSKLSDAIGVEWTGWIGRRFTDLRKSNEEIPKWVFRNYEKQYARKWEFKGKGYVLVKNDDTIVILEQKDLDSPEFWFEFTLAGTNLFNLNNNVGYYYWFDIVKAKSNSTILANYRFNLNKTGVEKLHKFSLPDLFPAIVLKTSITYSSYYFAGDFADKNNFPTFYQAFGLTKINALMVPKFENEDSFFWKVYSPVMEKIFSDVYRNKEKTIIRIK
jgi:hypothetical protein